jgi:hypothetical protein
MSTAFDNTVFVRVTELEMPRVASSFSRIRARIRVGWDA